MFENLLLKFELELQLSLYGDIGRDFALYSQLAAMIFLFFWERTCCFTIVELLRQVKHAETPAETFYFLRKLIDFRNLALITLFTLSLFIFFLLSLYLRNLIFSIALRNISFIQNQLQKNFSNSYISGLNFYNVKSFNYKKLLQLDLKARKIKGLYKVAYFSKWHLNSNNHLVQTF